MTAKPGLAPQVRPPGIEEERRRIRDIGVSDQLAIDIELASPRRTMAMWHVRLAGWLELEAQLVATLRHRFHRLHVKEFPTHVVVDIFELAILDIEAHSHLHLSPGTAALPPRLPWGSRHQR